MTTQKLKRLGFDESYKSEGYLKVRCSQCQAMTINGTPVHERGCPNEKKPRRSRFEVGLGQYDE